MTHFELFDHTADIGVRAWAPSLAGLVAPATAGLYAVLGEVVPQAAAATDWRCDLRGDDPAVLLRDYLAEVLLLFDCEHRRIGHLRVLQFDGGQLQVQATADAIDSARSVLVREIKAVTYHELAIRRTADGYEATFIVDI